MIKKTKRKAFNFLRSYFDVLNELTNDKDKLDFLIAIINKQFLNEDPINLNFIVNLCYESQRHQIETSVKGWLRATKEDLSPTLPTTPMTTLPTTPMTTLPTTPMTDVKEEEEEEKVKEKKESKTIPSIDEFVAYAISLKPNVNIENVKLKYNSWLVNDWKVNRQGKEKEIKNWKSTLSNTIQFLGEQQKEFNVTGNKQIDLLLKYKGVPIHEIPFDDRTPVHVYRQMHKGYE